jgi:flavin reductase (DIM6/NTAB) family NADH-FMN oxidoreductase RutF
VPPDEGPTSEQFRAAASQFATGITVVTTVLHGVDHAMTVNSFTAVSLDPLLVLVCAERSTRFHDAVLGSRSWAVSVLPETGQATAAWLATKGRPLAGQLDRVPHVRGELTGAAILLGSLSDFECETYAEYDGGDHTIVVGQVLGTRVDDRETGPLVYHRGHYRTVANPPA